MRRLHRALALAWESGAVPVVALTRCDLDPGLDAAAQAGALGVEVVPLSARTGEGLDAVAALARPARTIVLLGESGAGTSSLANALVGRPEPATGEVRRGDAKGRHTTTARHLVALPGGGALIDTPGVRALGLWTDEGGGVAVTFGDIEALAADCRSSDCGHLSEPGCAVLRALDDGELAEDRLASYRDLAREVAALERRGDERARRAHGREGSRVAREAQRRKGRHIRGER